MTEDRLHRTRQDWLRARAATVDARAEFVDAIQELLAEGWTQVEVADSLGWSRQRLFEFLNPKWARAEPRSEAR